MDRLYDTSAASKRLSELGIPRTKATLRRLRGAGGGPSYRVFNGKPVYSEADLIAWIEERLSPPRRSSTGG